jgi:hypothetical protein
MSYQNQYFSSDRKRKFKVMPNLMSNKGENLNTLTLVGEFGGDAGDIPDAFICDEIRMFGGDMNTKFPGGIGVDEWEDWFLCNGQSTPNGNTLDLRKKFIAGYDPDPAGDNQYNVIGGGDGENEVTLTAAQSGLPQHRHSVDPPTGSPSEAGDPHIQTIQSELGVNRLTGTAGPLDAEVPHENRPEFIVVAFVQYKGSCPAT